MIHLQYTGMQYLDKIDPLKTVRNLCYRAETH